MKEEMKEEMKEAMLLMSARNMEKFGGSFASHIAAAFFVADSVNRKRLVAAFRDLFERYAKWY